MLKCNYKLAIFKIKKKSGNKNTMMLKESYKNNS